MSPLISVIIPVYNVEKYLRRCLDSVLAQEYKNFEVICVNDGSTDSSATILQEYVKAYPDKLKVITQPNGGLSKARNTGLSIAKGEWITFVDSDDYIAFGCIEKIVSCITDDIDLICWGSLAVKDNENEKIPWLEVQNRHLRLRFKGKRRFCVGVAFKTPVTVWNKLFRKRIIQTQGIAFPPDLLFEDNAFYWKYFPFCRKAYFIPKSFYFYSQREQSIMGKLFTHRLPPVGYGCRIAADIGYFYHQKRLFKKYQYLLQKIFFGLFLLDFEHTQPENKQGILRFGSDIFRSLGFVRLSGFGKAVLAEKPEAVYAVKNGGFLKKLFTVSRDAEGRKYIYLLGLRIYCPQDIKESV